MHECMCTWLWYKCMHVDLEINLTIDVTLVLRISEKGHFDF